MCIRFGTKDIAPIGRIAAGVKAIKLKENDELLVGLPVSKNNDVAIFTTRGLGKRVKVSEFPIQGRGGVGVYAANESSIAGACMVDDTDNILVLGNNSSICVSATEIPKLSRASTGNQVIKNSKINSVSKV
jgi:DNA gyrase subunit A